MAPWKITMRQLTNNLEKLQTNENGRVSIQQHANSVVIPCENFLVELGQQEFSAGKFALQDANTEMRCR
jgi:hypothetical protein